MKYTWLHTSLSLFGGLGIFICLGDSPIWEKQFSSPQNLFATQAAQTALGRINWHQKVVGFCIMLIAFCHD